MPPGRSGPGCPPARQRAPGHGSGRSRRSGRIGRRAGRWWWRRRSGTRRGRPPGRRCAAPARSRRSVPTRISCLAPEPQQLLGHDRERRGPHAGGLDADRVPLVGPGPAIEGPMGVDLARPARARRRSARRSCVARFGSPGSSTSGAKSPTSARTWICGMPDRVAQGCVDRSPAPASPPLVGRRRLCRGDGARRRRRPLLECPPRSRPRGRDAASVRL